MNGKLAAVLQSSMGKMAADFCLTTFLAAFLVATVNAEKDFPLLMPMVKPATAESYICTPIRLSDTQTFYVNRFTPNASAHTAHHMLIYGCDEPGSTDSAWNCGEMAHAQEGMELHQPCKSGNQIIYAWAMDAPELKLPPDTGFRMGKHTQIKYLVMQIHYAHIDAIPKQGDNSGVILHYTETPQPQTAGVILMGTGGMTPGHSTTFFETACKVDDARTIHPFAFRTHTHSLGKVVSGWKISDGKDWSLIGKKSPKEPQMFYPIADPELTFTKGDILAARCTMVNHHDHDVYVGQTNNDEMCNFYIMYWVKGKDVVDKRVCFSPGPPYWSWKGSAMLPNIPDEAASTIP